MSAERRKQRLTWEALGDGDPTVPGAESLIRTLTIVGLVVFIVLFSGSFGGG